MYSRQIITETQKKKWDDSIVKINHEAEASFKKAINNEINYTNLPDLTAARDTLERHTIQRRTGNTVDLDAMLNDVIDDNTESILLSERAKILDQKQAQLSAQKPLQADNYASKLVKYIPTEVIAFYLSLSAIVDTNETPDAYLYSIGILIVGVLSTYFYLRSIGKVKSKVQLLVSCIAFVAWVISLDNNILKDYETLKALLLPIVTFMLPFINPPADEVVVPQPEDIKS